MIAIRLFFNIRYHIFAVQPHRAIEGYLAKLLYLAEYLIMSGLIIFKN
jgi:hypothetical protein